MILLVKGKPLGGKGLINSFAILSQIFIFIKLCEKLFEQTEKMTLECQDLSFSVEVNGLSLTFNKMHSFSVNLSIKDQCNILLGCLGQLHWNLLWTCSRFTEPQEQRKSTCQVSLISQMRKVEKKFPIIF